MTLYLTNTLTRTKEAFAPANPDHVTMMAATPRAGCARTETAAGHGRAMGASFSPPMRPVIEVHDVCASCLGRQVPT